MSENNQLGDQIDAQASHDQDNQTDIYIDDSDIADVVPESNEPEPEEDDDDMEGVDGGEMMEHDGEEGAEGEERIEVDMRNNAVAWFDKHEDSVFRVIAHPSVPLLVSGGGDNCGYMWTTNSNEPKLVTKLDGHKESVTDGGFTADGVFLVTSDMAGCVKLFHGTNKFQKWTEIDSIQEVEEVVWTRVHPEQNIVAFGATDGSVWVYSIEDTGFVSMTVLNGHSGCCTVGTWVLADDKDSLTLVTGSDDGSIVNWNVYNSVANYTLSATLFKGPDVWVSMAEDPTKKTLAAGAADGKLVLFKIDGGQLIETINTCSNKMEEGERSVEALSWCKSMKLLAAGTTSGQIMLYDTNTWRLRKILVMGDAVTWLQFVEDTPVLVAAAMDGVIRRFDARNGDEMWVGRGHNMGVLDMAITSQGKLVTAGDEGVCLVFDETSESLP